MAHARAEIESEWRRLRADNPGERFQNLHHRRQKKGCHLAQRIFTVAAGVLVIVVGLILVPGPGPGWTIAAAGCGLLGTEFLCVARWLDAAEVKIRSWLPQKSQGSSHLHATTRGEKSGFR